MRITEKSTKKEILDAYTAQKAELDRISKMKENPNREVEEKRKIEVKECVQQLVDSHLLSEEHTKQYQALVETLDDLSEQIKDRYDILAELNTLTSLVNTHKDMEIALSAEYKKMKEELTADFDEQKNILMQEIAELQAEKNRRIEQINKEVKEYQAAIKLKNGRDEEEYAYDLQRRRKIEDDLWQDEKAAREKEIRMAEEIVEAKEAEVDSKLDEFEDLKAKVEKIPELIKQAEETGFEKGKEKADANNEYRVRAIKSDLEHKIDLLDNEVQRVESELNDTKKEKEELLKKLDIAYEKMAALASTTAQANGGLRIISSDVEKAK